MLSARKHAKAFFGFVAGFTFGQDPAPDGHHRISGEDEGGASLRLLDPGRGLRLFRGETQSELARDFARLRGFIQIGGRERVRLDADLAKQG
jgi:hypothetical protein